MSGLIGVNMLELNVMFVWFVCVMVCCCRDWRCCSTGSHWCRHFRGWRRLGWWRHHHWWRSDSDTSFIVL